MTLLFTGNDTLFVCVGVGRCILFMQKASVCPFAYILLMLHYESMKTTNLPYDPFLWIWKEEN